MKTAYYAVGTFAIFCLAVITAQAEVTLITSSPRACVALTQALSRGSSDEGTFFQVSRLQRFLVGQGYLTESSVTGYFGPLTEGAVSRFQSSQGISTIGSVGPATRAAINRLSGCPDSVPTTVIAPPSYYNRAIVINRLSTNTGPTGGLVTVYGSGFEPVNTIIFGSVAIGGVVSTTTNTLTFRIPDLSTSCATYTIGGCAASGTPIVTRNGQYTIYIANSQGVSNGVTFSITNTPTDEVGPSVISLDGPITLTTNTKGIWTMLLDTKYDRPATVSVNWSDGLSQVKRISAKDRYLLTFEHAFATTSSKFISFVVSDDENPRLTRSIGYRVAVVSSVSNNLDRPTIRNAVSADGTVGTLVAIHGSGFSRENNQVHFGAGVIKGLPSYGNGSTILFTVPAYINPCDAVVSGNCAAPTIKVTSGTYPFFVVNNTGRQTAVFQFRVQ